MKEGRFWLHLFVIGMLACSLALAGCEGDDGDDGRAGLSAFEIAVQNGFTGTEEEWLAAIENPEFDESCNVCHGVDDDLAIDVFHNEVLEEPVISDVTVARNADNSLTVDFLVTIANEDAPPDRIGLAGLGSPPSGGSDLRVYLADIVPANTITGNVPQASWPTPFPELYAETRGSDAIVSFTDNGDGTYTYVIDPVVLDTDFGNFAPEGDLATHQQRIYIRADARDFEGLHRTKFVADFLMPAQDGSSVGPLIDGDTTRTIVLEQACNNCHGDPLEEAGHGGGYQSPQVCVMCHSPIGQFPEEVDGVDVPLGDLMQELEAWSGSLYHKIHYALDMPAFPNRIDGRGYGAVTFPKDVRNCAEVCHFDEGQDLATYFKDSPTIEACTTCHEETTFSGDATHSGGAQASNAGCTFCHPPDGPAGAGEPGSRIPAPVETLHLLAYSAPEDEGGEDIGNDVYDSNITLSQDSNADGVYEAGEEILVTVTVTNVDDATQVAPYEEEGAYNRANIYVYGPRSLAVPVLTPESFTDPDFVIEDVPLDPDFTPDQGRSMLIGDAAEDPNIQTDAEGFKYQLMEIPDSLEPGTYMVQVYVDHDSTRRRGSRNYPIDGWALTTFQIGTADEEPKVAGECTGCHDQDEWDSMYHRSYFGTDGCIACHDQSGNHADPLTNRVHAIHAASETGDLLENDWSFITFPRDLPESCVACHNSGADSYITAPNGTWGFACIGCHADTDGARAHMILNGAPIETEH